MSLTASSDDGGSIDSCQSDNPIPRDFLISNPSTVFVPEYRFVPTESDMDSFRIYQDFVCNELPKFAVDLNNLISSAQIYLKKVFEACDGFTIYHQLMMKQYLLSCQSLVHALHISPSMSKLSVLHHELYNAAQIIQKYDMDYHIRCACDMMLAETSDLYFSYFSDLLETRFWSKSKSTEDLTNSFLTREVERLRLLNDYTFNTLSSSIVRRTVDSAPSFAMNEVKKWIAKHNFVI